MAIKSWQYNGVDQFATILNWCANQFEFGDWYTNGYETIYFNNEKTYTMFMLRWA